MMIELTTGILSTRRAFGGVEIPLMLEQSVATMNVRGKSGYVAICNKP